MFNFIKQQLQQLYQQVSSKLAGIFNRSTINSEDLEELERILIAADTGVATTRAIIAQLKEAATSGMSGQQLKEYLHTLLLQRLQAYPFTLQSDIVLLVGINGSGKTTCASKLTYALQQQHKKVLLVAADTFRAAATEQLTQWAQKTNTDIITGTEQQDPAAVIFKGCDAFSKNGYDVMIIDTAGRLQTKINLMKELEKIGRIIHKQLPNTKVATLLTIDSMLGQNSLDQARLFHESTKLDGIILTKMDGSAKGGIIFAITDVLKIPIAYISYGEQIEKLAPFNAKTYVTDLLS